MVKSIFVFLFFSLIFGIQVQGASFTGDGTYTVSRGDTITADNGWTLTIDGIYDAAGTEYASLAISDENGVYYPTTGPVNSLKKIDGAKQFGTGAVMKIEAEFIELSGTMVPMTAVVGSYQYGKISVKSIDEEMPGIPESTTPQQGTVLTDTGGSLTFHLKDKLVLSNGYSIQLVSFATTQQNNKIAYFDVFDENGIKFFDYSLGNSGEIEIPSADSSMFVGSAIRAVEIGDTSARIKITKGSRITFGTGWNLFSIPVDDGNGYGIITETNCNKGPIWQWNKEINDYEKLGVVEKGVRIPSGAGIWIKVQAKPDVTGYPDCTIVISGTNSVSLKGKKLFKGWNSIGSPLSAMGRYTYSNTGSVIRRLSFEDIKGNCNFIKGPWQFIQYEYSNVVDTNRFSRPLYNNLDLFRGYFVKVDGDCELG